MSIIIIPCRIRLYVALAAATLVCGCAGFGSLSPDVPPGITLAGVWRLNPAQSDDPRKVLERLRERAREQAGREQGIPDQQPRQSRRRGQGQGQGQDTQQGPRPTADEQYPGDAGGPTRQTDVRSPFVQIMGSDLLRNEVLAIHQSADAFVLDYGSSVRRLTPGARSVISVPGGVGDQKTGWKGKSYVVDIRSQVGPDISEQYELSDKNGKQLVVKVHLSGSGTPNTNLTLVYDPAGNATPRSAPSLE